MSQNKEFVKVDFSHHNPKFQYFKDGTLVKQWNVKKQDAEDMVFNIIEGQGMSNFEANKIKSTLYSVTQIFQPKTIKIIKKEPNE